MPASISNSSVISFAAMSAWSASDPPARQDSSAPERTYVRTDDGHKRRCIESSGTTRQATHPLQWDPDADLAERVRNRGPMRDDSPPLERFRAGTLVTPAIVKSAFLEDFQILLLNHPDLSDKMLHKRMLGRYPTTDLDTVRALRARYAAVEAATHPAELLRSFVTTPGLSPSEQQARQQDLEAWITGTMLRLGVKELPLAPPGHLMGSTAPTGPGQSPSFRPASPGPSLDPPSIVTISGVSEPQLQVQPLEADRTTIVFPPTIGLRSPQPPADVPDAVPKLPWEVAVLDLDGNITALLEIFRNDPLSPGMPGMNDLDAYIRRPFDISPSEGQDKAP